MFKGIVFTLSACFLWGFIFIIPSFLGDFSSLEITLARYFFYGIISILFFGTLCFKSLIQYPIAIWMKALWFGLISNIIYYTSIVLAVHYSNPGVTALIVGISPVAISFYGNFKQTECQFSKLIFPSFLILVGLLVVNLEQINGFSHSYLLGIGSAFIALISWSWYVVANRAFLKAYPSMNYFEWSTMLGLTTFVWVVVGIFFFCTFILEPTQLQRYFLLDEQLTLFILLTAVLGVVCSWLGSYLWNSGCTLIPVSLGGQMTIFETLFGILFVYLVEKRVPTFLEISGILCMITAIIYTMNLFKQRVI